MTKTKTKKSRIINLEDLNGSVSSNFLICRDVLWGIVEYIKENDSIERNSLDVDENLLELAPDLPISFGSTKGSNSKKRKREEKKELFRKRVKPTTETLKTPEYNGKLVEHNVYYYKSKENGQDRREIVKVAGVGMEGLGSVALRRLQDNTILTIPRSSTYLSCVPVSHYNKEIYDLCEADIWWKLNQHKPEDVHEKYWDQRYRIFSRFDQGIRLDAESWYSITYETIGKYIMEKYRVLEAETKMGIETVLDCFSGCGGMSIPFASAGKTVYAIDWDPTKVDYLKHNSAIYGVEDHVQGITADVWSILASHCDPVQLSTFYAQLHKLYATYDLTVDVIPQVQAILNPLPPANTDITQNDGDTTESIEGKTESLSTRNATAPSSSSASLLNDKKIDMVILSPPWGGPDYTEAAQYDITTMLTCGDGYQLALLAATVAKHIIYILPRNTTDAMLMEVAKIISTPYTIEHIYLSGKLKLKILYIGHKSN